MNLRNNFSEETRLLFFYNYECFWCTQNSWDALHHILGRVSSSPLNACPIHNSKCHIGNSRLDNFESRSRLLKKTLSFLLANGYKLTEEDLAFKEKYGNFYNN